MIGLKKIKELEKFDENALVIIDNEVTINWRQYRSMVTNIANQIYQSKKYINMSRALVISSNRWEMLILFSALTSLGVEFSSVDYTQEEKKLLECILVSKADTIFYSKNNFSIKSIENNAPATIKFICIDDLSFDDVRKNELVFVKKNDKNLNFSFTSGTTGVPKLIFRDFSFDTQRLKLLNKLYSFNEHDKFLITLPLYHVSVIGWIKLVLSNRGTIVFGSLHDSKKLRNELLDQKITSFLITPPVLKKLSDELPKNIFFDSNVRFIMVGGKNFPTVLKEKVIIQFGSVINEYYGTSETGINTLISSQEMLKYPESSGKCMEGSDVIILGRNNEILTYNKIGKIAIKSFQNANGYFKKKMKDFMLGEERYIVTADYGYLNEKDYLFVTQRGFYDNQVIDDNIYNYENHIRLIEGIDDVVIIQNKNNKYVIKIQIDSSFSILKRNMIRDHVVNNILFNSSHEYTIEFLNLINYSLSGKVVYRELLNEGDIV